MSSTVLTTQLLLSALRLGQTGEGWISAWQGADGDWDDLVMRAIVTGLGPQLHRRFTQWGVEAPARARAKLEVVYKAQARRNRAIYEQLAAIIEACEGEGVRPIALKGVHLAAQWYDAPALRPMDQIDLLFDPTERKRGTMAMAELGYEAQESVQSRGDNPNRPVTFHRNSQEQGAAERDCAVTLHTSLEESHHGLRVNITPGVRARAITVPFAGLGVPVLALEDLLLHLCVHSCFHLIRGEPFFIHLTDLQAVSESQELNWEVLVERARAYRTIPYSLAPLLLTQRLLDAWVPVGVLEDLAELTPLPMRRMVMELDLADVIERTERSLPHDRQEQLLDALQAGWQAVRWAPDWRTRWRVGKRALGSVKRG